MSDLISREQTYKILCEEYPLLQKGYLRRVIDEVPSAERIGHWIELYENNYQCSECNAWWTCEDTPIASGMNFCPNCGAKMESDK